MEILESRGIDESNKEKLKIKIKCCLTSTVEEGETKVKGKKSSIIIITIVM